MQKLGNAATLAYKAARNELVNVAADWRMMIISLSSIPPRFAALDRCLWSLLSQVRPAKEIRLYIPDSYRRFPDWDGTLPDVPEGVTIMRTELDLGPATKILPAVRDLQDRSTEILYCDDDRIYDPHWTSSFLEQRALRPDCAIVECGLDIGPDRGTAHSRQPRALRITKGLRYRAVRAASLGRHKPHPWIRSGYVDVAEGYGGVLVRPDFFPPEVFDIPDILWTVDDYWLSGWLETNDVGIWLNSGGKMSRESDAASSQPLLNFRLQDTDTGRNEANAACIAWFQRQHGIW